MNETRFQHETGCDVGKVIQLSGDWRLRQAGTQDWVPATVPGCVHTDLLAAGRIPDPLVGTHELDVLWLAEVDWEYERNFEVDAGFLARGGKWLVCEGLDTVAEITINDRPVAETRNMFQRYRFDVGPHLRPGTNRIRITFQSPIRYGRQQSEKLPYELPGSKYDWGTGRTRLVYRPYVRKAQYQFGWDWGPCLITSGIRKDIRLVAGDAPQIEYVTTQQHHEADRVRLTVNAHLLAPHETDGRLEVSVGEATTVVPAHLNAGDAVIGGEMVIESPELWWPRGFGAQKLYPVTVRWVDCDGAELARAQTRVGLRAVELIRKPDEIGESFFFRVNGRDIFCKGANWIPADPFPTRVRRDRYERLIRAAYDANMNMLRVWGGGIYEDPVFYDLCDEQGIMVWQDFMFACAAYPADDAFLAEVAGEVRHQVRRLINHPSIVMWCGDNEDEWAVRSWWHQNEGDPSLRPDYDRLITGTIAPIVAAEDPGRPWWPSSPSNGGTGDPTDLNRGDAHFWEVWHGGQPFERYLEVVPRFCSEFGFQSFPSLATLLPVVGADVGDINDPVMKHHQRHGRGNAIIGEAIERLFRKPSNLDDLCYLSQISQGLALQTAVEHWRRSKPRCMGTLYWQLQDCWVVASWASIDYELRYKAAHYFAKRFYSPLLGSMVEHGDGIQIWATSDLPDPLAGTYVVEAWTLAGDLQQRIEGNFDLDRQASRVVATLPLDRLFSRDVPANDRLLRLRVGAADLRHETVHAFVPYKELDLHPPDITTTVMTQGTSPRVALQSDVPALFVELDGGAIPGVFSDNFFALFPGEPREIELVPADRADAVELQTNLKIRTLRSTYDPPPGFD
ncbi:MAG: glycoside hydrolase family 2 protein [bacterium]|nr:glycoside hydrolase family 2 protein [bacterium]